MTVEVHAGDDDYRKCASDLLEAGIAAETVAAACALALQPTEISECVTGVIDIADIAPVTALSACSRDRRPHEVASCVTEIHETLEVPNSNSVLTLCHRSLLPERYSACVIGLVKAADFTTGESLSRCIAAGYRPENIAPTFIPAN